MQTFLLVVILVLLVIALVMLVAISFLLVKLSNELGELWDSNESQRLSIRRLISWAGGTGSETTDQS